MTTGQCPKSNIYSLYIHVILMFNLLDTYICYLSDSMLQIRCNIVLILRNTVLSCVIVDKHVFGESQVTRYYVFYNLFFNSSILLFVPILYTIHFYIPYCIHYIVIFICVLSALTFLDSHDPKAEKGQFLSFFT
jgi:hypothetical protein